jgi:hypothetical protein
VKKSNHPDPGAAVDEDGGLRPQVEPQAEKAYDAAQVKQMVHRVFGKASAAGVDACKRCPGLQQDPEDFEILQLVLQPD